MDAKKALFEYKQKVDVELESFFQKVISENEKIDVDIAGAMDYVRQITMAGGKRARAAFMYYGYLAAGGTRKKDITRASISTEIMHSFALIHDDIIDQDSLRHGITTTHVHYSKMAKKYFKNKNAAHFGDSMAIVVGDMINALGNRVLLEANFSPHLVAKAAHRLQNIIFITIVGETEDILIENRGQATEKEILQMYKNKTATYTIEGPLHIGAILAGADEKFLLALSNYAIPTGIAFQIQDDVLGIFGTKSKTGKSIDSDIRQGKQTILVVKAQEKANKKQKTILKNCLGNKNLTETDLADFKQVIIDTGSLKYAQAMATKLITKAKNEITNQKISKEAKDFLINIADYMLNREI
ncbi:polyprenyl synthetase family protein [Candidatus Parcubacteria bacterium]|nr:polyprenyl synthetase family protein [Patescibacteria group bacterium]MBU4309863.1 polyprenyl synthetase family protein [Patescibacteria group bacterium]MBU4431726.1 polyprenyl synthetase family protein [Patescibacteria group bacterium]MBU4578202.1 polyprenyl synthetase family protein [Patescibacteria group bacterium]MCG2696738.1 polyprenyl synthetase family protein [Candidatus Parcubacteria bacterium]